MDKKENYVYPACDNCGRKYHFALLLVHEEEGLLCPECIIFTRQHHKGKEEFFDELVSLILKFYQTVLLGQQITAQLDTALPPEDLREFKFCSCKCDDSAEHCVTLSVCGHSYCSECVRHRRLRRVMKSPKQVKFYEIACTLCMGEPFRKVKDRFDFFTYPKNAMLGQSLSIGQQINNHYALKPNVCFCCKEEFNLSEKWPQIIPCDNYGHLACRNCLLDNLALWIQCRESNFKEGRPSKVKFVCPLCGQPCPSVHYNSKNPKEIMKKYFRLKRFTSTLNIPLPMANPTSSMFIYTEDLSEQEKEFESPLNPHARDPNSMSSSDQRPIFDHLGCRDPYDGPASQISPYFSYVITTCLSNFHPVQAQRDGLFNLTENSMEDLSRLAQIHNLKCDHCSAPMRARQLVIQKGRANLIYKKHLEELDPKSDTISGEKGTQILYLDEYSMCLVVIKSAL